MDLPDIIVSTSKLRRPRLTIQVNKPRQTIQVSQQPVFEGEPTIIPVKPEAPRYGRFKCNVCQRLFTSSVNARAHFFCYTPLVKTAH